MIAGESRTSTTVRTVRTRRRGAATTRAIGVVLLTAALASGMLGGAPDSAAAAEVVGAGSYENDSSAITYSGGPWTTMKSSAASGGSIAYTSKAGSASLTFSGDRVRWETWKSPTSGYTAVFLDGVPVATVDRYAPTTQYGVIAYDSGTIPSGTHTIRIEYSAQRNPSAGGGNTILDRFIVDAQTATANSKAAVGLRYADCPAATKPVRNRTEFVAALESAAPGDVIVLAPGTYPYGYRLQSGGTAQKPIWICGPRSAVIDGGSIGERQALVVQNAPYVRLAGFTVRNALQGVMVKNSPNVAITDLRVEQIGYEAVHLYAFTTDGVVAYNSIANAGSLDVAYGEGIYIGTSQRRWDVVTAGQPDRSDRTSILYNTIVGSGAEAIEAKEGTSDGLIHGNRIEGHRAGSRAIGWVLVTGSNWTVAKNTGSAAVEHGYASMVWGEWGVGNEWTGNTGVASSPGWGLWIHTPGGIVPSGTQIGCSNWITQAALGNTSLACNAP